MRNAIIDEFKKLGYTDAQIAGILGNIAVETGGTFDYQQKQIGAKSPAHGIFQLDPNGGKFQDYLKWLKKNKKEDSVASQVGFFHDTIYGKSVNIPGAGNAAKIRKGLESDDPAKIAQLLSDKWLMPQKGKEHNDRRVAEAINSLKLLQATPTDLQPSSMPATAAVEPTPQQPTALQDSWEYKKEPSPLENWLTKAKEFYNPFF